MTLMEKIKYSALTVGAGALLAGVFAIMSVIMGITAVVSRFSSNPKKRR